MDARRSRDVPQLTWELPAAAGACWLLMVLLMLPAGQGIGAWLSAGRFMWPHSGAQLVGSIGGLLSGHPGHGLTRADAARLASTPLIYVLIVFGELLLTAVAVWIFVVWWRRLGPGAWQGMAARAEVERVLGVSNLRNRRAIIRPDLHSPRGKNSRRGGG